MFEVVVEVVVVLIGAPRRPKARENSSATQFSEAQSVGGIRDDKVEEVEIEVEEEVDNDDGEEEEEDIECDTGAISLGRRARNALNILLLRHPVTPTLPPNPAPTPTTVSLVSSVSDCSKEESEQNICSSKHPHCAINSPISLLSPDTPCPCPCPCPCTPNKNSVINCCNDSGVGVTLTLAVSEDDIGSDTGSGTEDTGRV